VQPLISLANARETRLTCADTVETTINLRPA
jgi:hypothetical protein